MVSTNKKIALQLYSIRSVGDLKHRLELAKETGYDWIESEVTYGLSAREFADRLSEFHLQLASMHVEMNDLTERMSLLLDTLTLTHCHKLVMPWLEENERPSNLVDWRNFSQKLNLIAEKLAENGIELAYHNHAFEFSRLENGQTILEVILESAPQLLWQADVAWVVRAGENAEFWLDKFSAKIASVHVKDLAESGQNPDENDWANLGEGKIAWPTLLQKKLQHLDTFIVEHDQPLDPRHTALIGNQYLRKHLQ